MCGAHLEFPKKRTQGLIELIYELIYNLILSYYLFLPRQSIYGSPSPCVYTFLF